MLENRAFQALRRPANWIQLAKFGAVGLTGALINLAVSPDGLRAAAGSDAGKVVVWDVEE